MMNTALTQSAILIFLIILGYVLKRVGLFRQEDSKVLSNIMLYVTLPAVLVNAFRSFTLDVHLFSFVLLGLLANVILLVVGWKVGARETPLVHAMYMICLAGYNIGSFSIPFVQNLFPQRMMEVVLFDIGNSIINCGVSYSFARMQMVPGSRFQPWSMVKTLLSTYPFNLYIVLLALSLMHVSFPEPVYQLADTVAAANPVVVMLMLGIMFEVRLGSAERYQVLGIVTSRVLTEAVMAALLVWLLPFPLEQRLIAALLVCAPISGMATVFCGKLQCDPSVYGTATSLTIPISIAVMLGLSLV